MSTFEHSIVLSWTPLLNRRRVCVVNVKISESFNVQAEVAPGDFHVLVTDDHREYSTTPFSFSFDDVRSRRIFDLCERHLLNLRTRMHPATRQYLVNSIVECGMNLPSTDDVECGYDIVARLDVEYFRVADEEELAPFRQFDDMDDDDDDDMDEEDDPDDMEDEDEANPRFKGVEKGRYNGRDGKEVIKCSVCLEDLSSGMEFNKLPCSHIFHSTCIDRWLKRNTTCPNCRTKLTKLEQRGQCCGCEIYV